jgi:alpha-N-acetylglucosaminidase
MLIKKTQMKTIFLKMKKRNLLSLLLLLQFGFASANSIITDSKLLISRIVPKNASSFQLEIIPSEGVYDVFEIESGAKGKIILRGNNGIALATALNCYLREVVHVSYDWQAINPLILSDKLPLVPNIIHRKCVAQERFFNNTCTFGYTFAYWTWESWERYIDWLALNGINRPLMLAGQEAVWSKVWKSFGMTDNELRDFFAGPTQLPWQRMANFDKWGGPLPISYIEGQRKLQQKILNRCRQLGMKPILPAFAGHIPEKFKTLYPKSSITQVSLGWNEMESKYATFFLDPGDSLFNIIQKRFIKEQRKLYGTDHLYSADPFNEITPPSWEPDYLAKVGKTIYQSMAAEDKEAIWYQMSWTFGKDWTQPRLSAMIHAVPKGKLVFLDYVCEEQEYFKKSQNFYGAPFIWCYLGNFGGNTHLVAPMHKVSTRIENALPVSNCLGVGSTLEGINANPQIYEMVMEIPWITNTSTPFVLDKWITNFATRRAGHADEKVNQAWHLLTDKVLVDSAMGIMCHSVAFQVRPLLDIDKSHWSTDPRIPYNNKDLARVLEILLQADTISQKSDAYQYDVVNIARQTFGNYGAVINKKMVKAYQNKDIKAFRLYANHFMTLGMEIDTLLGSRHEFLVGRWLGSARYWGKTDDEKSFYERNAREIITCWYKAGGALTDYSNRQWNGLMRRYYLPRWAEFIKRMEQSMVDGKEIDTKDFAKWCTGFEQNWLDVPTDGFIENETGNGVQIAKRMFEKYKNEIL